MPKKIPLLGKVVGKLTCIDDSEKAWPGFERKIKVKCECSEIERVSAQSFREEKYTACNKCKPRINPKFKSVLGQPFGNWTVIEEKERGKNRRVLCRCKCKLEEMVFVHSLRSGDSTGCKSCGQFESVLGKKFGDLTVIEEKERGLHRRVKCRCKCGRIAMVQVCNLLSGHSTGCQSCKGFESVLGEKFCKLIVTAEPETGRDRHVLCDCDCGTKDFRVYLTSLKSGHTKSCGCLKHYESYDSGIIYYLLDPITMKVRYVGQTVRDPHKRLSEHIYDTSYNKQKQDWILSLYPYKPQPVVMEESIPLDKLDEREAFHIAKCLKRRQPLLNIRQRPK